MVKKWCEFCSDWVKKLIPYIWCFFFRLDLDKWINDPPSESSEEEEEIDTIFDTPNEHKYDLRQLSKFSIIRQLYKMKVFSGSKLILV